VGRKEQLDNLAIIVRVNTLLLLFYDMILLEKRKVSEIILTDSGNGSAYFILPHASFLLEQTHQMILDHSSVN
jgi:hypothetical protein